MTWVRDKLAALRWRLTMARWEIEARAAALVAAATLAAFVTAMLIRPDWTLRFSRVLAWPVVAVIALIAFRLPLSGLLSNRALSRFSLGPGGLSGELEQREEPFDPAQLPPAANDQAVAPDAILLLANLAQTYQFQIDFLRHIQQAANGLSNEAARAWMRNALSENPLIADWEIEPLLGWLVERNLLTLLDDDRYVLGPLGADFISTANTIWYVPKLL